MAELQRLIRLYHQTILNLFPRVAAHLGVPLPPSNIAWALLPLGVRAQGETPDGVQYRKHGYGLEIQIEDVWVDFDFGQQGEVHGVDPWKLAAFVQTNKIPSPLQTPEEISEAFEEAEEAGLMHHVNELYYYV